MNDQSQDEAGGRHTAARTLTKVIGKLGSSPVEQINIASLLARTHGTVLHLLGTEFVRSLYLTTDSAGEYVLTKNEKYRAGFFLGRILSMLSAWREHQRALVTQMIADVEADIASGANLRIGLAHILVQNFRSIEAHSDTIATSVTALVKKATSKSTAYQRDPSLFGFVVRNEKEKIIQSTSRKRIVITRRTF